MSAPKEPPYSCPNLDSAISEIEEARKIHNLLRQWGEYYKDRCGEIEKEYSNMVDERDAEIKELERQVSNLEERIMELEEELSQMPTN